MFIKRLHPHYCSEGNFRCERVPYFLCFAAAFTLSGETAIANTVHNPTWVYVGSYAGEANSGGIYSYQLQGSTLKPVQHINEPYKAGYKFIDVTTATLYSVDERKNDGHGPVGPAASVYAYRIDPHTGN